MQRAIVKLAMVFAASMLFGCSSPSDVAEESNSGDEALYGSKSWKWDNPKAIHVCWVNPSAANLHGRVLVRHAVERTWEKESHGSVNFVGWGACRGSGHGGVSIQVVDSSEAPNSYVGRYSASQYPSMHLNFTFAKWNRVNCHSELYVDRCIEISGVHEFGHALGFYHEQDSPKTPKPCLDQLSPSQVGAHRDGVQLTPWDEESVMNYCNAVWDNLGELSHGDKVGLRKYY